MSKDPAFLFYPGDYLTGTMGMTFEEKGAYLELLMMQFSRGHMTSHMIAHTVGHLWDKIKDKFVQDKNGLWYNKRLEEEIIKRKRYSQSRRNNLTGVNQHTKKNKNEQGHMTTHMENEVEKESKEKGDARGNLLFNSFWDQYDKKVDRQAVKTKWDKLTLKEQQDIVTFLPAYITSTPDKSFRRNPLTFLNRSTWKNEITISPINNKLVPASRHDSDFD